MKRPIIVSAFWLMITSVGLTLAQAQGESLLMPSLGELARQLKADRAKAAQKPVKVFTNDNLPARPAGSGLTVASTIAETTAETTGTGAGGISEVHDEKYYRKAVGEIGSRLEVHQRQLAVLEQKLAQNQMQYYADPNKTLQQESTPAFYSDVNKLRQDIEKKKQEIAADEQEIEHLRDQLRREGGPPGWLR